MTRRLPAPLLTDWYPEGVKPVRVGAYNATNDIDLEPDVMRWWDGVRWSVPYYADDYKKVRDRCSAAPGMYQDDVRFRGLRMWVLTAETSLGTLYMIYARPKSSKFGHLIEARPFKSERVALRFAARYSYLGLTAVLP